MTQALGIISTLSGDQATIGKLKEDLEAEKKQTVQLQDSVAKLESDKGGLLKRNGNRYEVKRVRSEQRDHSTEGRTGTWKAANKKWRPKVDLAINKLNLLSMCDAHNKVCRAFTPRWDEYCDEYKASGEKENASRPCYICL